jgi:hypothetical protein
MAHLHHGLADRAALENPGRTVHEAGEAGSDGGELIYAVGRQAL